MSIPVSCPECFAEFAVPEKFAGRAVKCKSCGSAVRVPQAAAADDGFDDFDEPAAPRAQLPARPAVVRNPGAGRPPAKKAEGSKWPLVLGIAGAAVVAVLLCCGGVVWTGYKKATDAAVYANEPDFGPPTAPFPVAAIPLPAFPDLGPPRTLDPSGVVVYEADCGTVPGNGAAAGQKTAFRVYLPPGEHAPRSLPCVLVAPAGSPLITGMPLDDSEYHDETLPYAEAGFAVIHYSLDGAGDDGEANPRDAYLRFRASCAGVVNGRNALEFALAKLPAVDPARIYAAGHSSAANASLLLAEHEPRLAGCVAYAPEADVVATHGEIGETPGAGLLFPKVGEFVTQSSPLTHAASLKAPTFLFHAKNDDTTDFAGTEKLAAALKANGTDVTLETVEDGDHYESMSTDGMPKAIDWLKAKAGLPSEPEGEAPVEP